MNAPHRALALLSVLLAGLVFAQPAFAHRLKLFATVEDMTVSGYAFFIGGGRPYDAKLTITAPDGETVFEGRTDDSGAYSWVAPKVADYVLAVDTGDGHVADATIAADRFFDGSEPDATRTVQQSDPPPDRTARPAATPAEPQAASGIDEAEIARLTESAVDRAVARQIRPLLEAYDQADGRLRFNDIMGGIGMIVGLAGLGAWALSRRSSHRDQSR
ncbi:cobalamin biosynthesis protein CbiM [Consotaella aegiceratis]|uniref:cobalamin biosynthesis protein CbiM n=1 Tax=Consotaella aegiceratis TaxID=3097961 RepID=UPI002F42247B